MAGLPSIVKIIINCNSYIILSPFSYCINYLLKKLLKIILSAVLRVQQMRRLVRRQDVRGRQSRYEVELDSMELKATL